MWHGNGSLQPGLQSSSDGFIQLAGLELNQQMLPVLLGLLLVTGIAWIFLSSRLYGRLQQNYPGFYKKLGSPQPLIHRSFIANYRIFGFLFKPDHGIPLDSEIKRLAQGLRALFCIYLICLAGSVVLLIQRWHLV